MPSHQSFSTGQGLTSHSPVGIQGSPSLPGHAVGAMAIRVRCLPPSNALPVAHTCFLELDLPLYDDSATFEDKFRTAIYGTVAFDRV